MIDYQAAIAHFQANDQTMARLAKQAQDHEQDLTIPKKRPSKLYFEDLVSAIVGQQLSTKAAATIWQRFVDLAGEVTPKAIAALSHDDLRQVGMSNAKADYVHGLAEAVASGQLKLNDIDKLDDEAVIERLVSIKGIGRWSAEMFLMFSLGRPDVFSAGDLGLIRAIEQHYQSAGIKPEEATALARQWSPHRTTAALLLWHSRDNKPLV